MPDSNPQEEQPLPEKKSEARPDSVPRTPLDRLERHTADLMDKRGMGGFGLQRFALMGFEFLGVTLVFGGIGHWLDGKFGWPGYATVTCIVVAVLGELYLQIKTLLAAGKKEKPDR